MYSIGSLIFYGSTGVCRVDSIGDPPFRSSKDEKKPYYTLTPLRGHGTIYVPVDSKVFMRPILSRQAAEQLIDRIPEISQAQCEGSDHRMLAQQYRTFLDTHCCEDLIQLIKAVYTKSQALTQAGRKPGKVDQDFQKRAEALLHDEFAAALDIPFEQVGDYITQRVNRLSVQ